MPVLAPVTIARCRVRSIPAITSSAVECLLNGVVVKSLGDTYRSFSGREGLSGKVFRPLQVGLSGGRAPDIVDDDEIAGQFVAGEVVAGVGL
jgi:hypothetical protein